MRLDALHGEGVVISGHDDDPTLFPLYGVTLVLFFVWFTHHVTDPLTIVL